MMVTVGDRMADRFENEIFNAVFLRLVHGLWEAMTTGAEQQRHGQR